MRFVDEYLRDGNGTRAYRAAYPGAPYAAARTGAARLRKVPAVAAELKAGRAAQRRRTRVTADRVLRELAVIAFGDTGGPFDLNGRPIPVNQSGPATRRAIAARTMSNTTDAPGVTRETFHVRSWDKPRALEVLARHFGFDRPLTPLAALLEALLGPAPRPRLGRRERPQADVERADARPRPPRLTAVSPETTTSLVIHCTAALSTGVMRAYAEPSENGLVC